MPLEAIKYQRGTLSLLDQRLLPFETVFLEVSDLQTAWRHIKDMVVRGAPAIGITGALALAVDLSRNKQGGNAFANVGQAVQYVNQSMEFLVTSRPTAVNLQDAAAKLEYVTKTAALQPGATATSVVEAVIQACEQMMADDIHYNQAMGRYGAEALMAAVLARGLQPKGSKLRVLTHCNTGSLATAGYGTALGVIRSLHAAGHLEHVYCCETRPYNQGARLTAFELVHDGLPATLICDSAAAALMAQGKVDAVVVGADRIVANGDTANKIGTYCHALSCAAHNLPFFVAAPSTTLDPTMSHGSQIVIEQRDTSEVTHFKGQPVAAAGIQVWNPAFDVTPGRLIEAIITEHGLIPKIHEQHQVAEFMALHGLLNKNHPAAAPGVEHGAREANGGPTLPAAAKAIALDESSVRTYVAERVDLAKHVGMPETQHEWKVREVGDGNINFVYIIEGPSGSLAIKQALPYVRCVGESWPLSLDRLDIEARALAEQATHCPAHVPQLFLHDPQRSVVAMTYLKPPLGIVRRGLIAGTIYPHLGKHCGDFLAQTLFHTSFIYLDSATFRRRIQEYHNQDMCALTEQVIFTEPLTEAANNKWLSPQLDADVDAIHRDVEAKVALSVLKQRFMAQPQALLHGDLHTGSIMADVEKTFVIDPEFAFYGPIAFDTGKLMGELLINYLASDGLESNDGVPGGRATQRAWLCSCISSVWETFSTTFVDLWNKKGLQGCMYPAALLGADKPSGQASLVACQHAFMKQLWNETVSFMGACMLRRIIGIAEAADLSSISDITMREMCERRGLRLGLRLLTTWQDFASPAAVLTAAAELRNGLP